MAVIRYNNVGMTAIAACVPPKVVSNYDLGYMMDEEAIERVVKSTGIIERRIADKDVCSSDLCVKATEKLMTDNNVAPESIDMLIFTTLTPDFVSPPTTPIIQKKLNLPNTTACIDLSFACSGFIYALGTAYAFASSNGINRVLVLVGETMSKITSDKDKVNWPLYGDAGTAFLVEKGDFGESIFELTADGVGQDFVKVPYGRFRNPMTAENLEMKEREDGNFRRDTDITMDGMETFNHAITAIPRQVKTLMKDAEITVDDIDLLVSHQANKMMIDFITKKLKIPSEKVPFCLQKYGNTSCASIPLTIVSELCGKMEGENRVLFSAIGAGWSFGTAYMTLRDLKVSPIFDY